MVSLFRHYYYCIESRQRNYLGMILNMNNSQLYSVILMHQELIQSDCSIKSCCIYRLSTRVFATSNPLEQKKLINNLINYHDSIVISTQEKEPSSIDKLR